MRFIGGNWWWGTRWDKFQGDRTTLGWVIKTWPFCKKCQIFYVEAGLMSHPPKLTSRQKIVMWPPPPPAEGYIRKETSTKNLVLSFSQQDSKLSSKPAGRLGSDHRNAPAFSWGSGLLLARLSAVGFPGPGKTPAVWETVGYRAGNWCTLRKFSKIDFWWKIRSFPNWSKSHQMYRKTLWCMMKTNFEVREA